jgi:hypothetical protein
MIRTNILSAEISHTSAAILAPANPNRVALLFSPPVTGYYTLGLEPQSLNAGKGLNVAAGAGPVLLTRDLFGDGLDRSWWVVASGPGGPTVAVAVESFKL